MPQSNQTFAEKLRFKLHTVELKAMGLVLGKLPMRETTVYAGADAVASLAQRMGQDKLNKALIVTTSGAVKRGYTEKVAAALNEVGIGSAVFDGVLPDPTYSNVGEGLAVQKAEGCDCVLALGGGSTIDAAKAIVVAATNNKPLEKLVGIRKGRNKPLPLYAVPTTSGTASEVTQAAVISEDESHKKRFIIDTRTISRAAALDPSLSASLPPSITAETGMDALTHAIEAYLGRLSTAETDGLAMDAIVSIFEHLPVAFKEGDNLNSRQAMAKASLVAGKAFRRSPLGYVHAISHQLGALYGLPHGQGNAILLPHVVEYSKDVSETKLAKLAVALGLGKSSEVGSQLATKVVEAIRRLNDELGIPQRVEALNPVDIPEIAKRAYDEALSIHAAPKYMGKQDLEAMLKRLL